jgi:hypothetical protein
VSDTGWPGTGTRVMGAETITDMVELGRFKDPDGT